MADLTDYTRGFLDGIKLARAEIRRFKEEHPLLFPVLGAIVERIGDAEMEALLRLHHAETKEVEGG